MSQKYIIQDSYMFALRVSECLVDSMIEFEREKYPNRTILAVYPDQKGVPKQQKGIKLISTAFIVNGRGEDCIVSNVFLSKNEKTKEYIIRLDETRLDAVVEITIDNENINSQVYADEEDENEEELNKLYSKITDSLDEFLSICGMNG